MNHSKVAIAVGKTISLVQMLAGIFLVLIFSLCTIGYLTDKSTADEVGVAFLICSLVLDALGIWLIVLAIKKQKLIQEFKKYVAAISSDPRGYIPDIARALGASERTVRNNLELMIRKNFFSNAYIDRNTDCIVLANKRTVVQNTSSDLSDLTDEETASDDSNVSTVEMVTVKCKGCGGINTVAKGQIGECDYCGSPLKGE